MSLIKLLNDDMIKAMKEHNKRELSVIRMVKAAIQLEEINKQQELTDEDVIGIIMKQVKMRHDSITEFKKGNRDDLVEETEKEITILNKYLPEQLSDEEVEQIIDQVIKEYNYSSSNDMGNIMREVVPKVKGKYDLSKVNAIIKNKLS